MSDFMLPDIGEGIVECEVVEWRVAEGDVIEEDQPVVEVMTDKALVEITAPQAGRVTRLYVPKGEIAKVHAPLYAYEVEGAMPAPETATETPVVQPKVVQPKVAQPQVAARDFILPDIGEGIVECEVVEWRVSEGETIAEDQPVVDVMTDKALVEITAPEAGVVSKLHVGKGEIAKVHAPLYAYQPEGTEASLEEPQAVARQASTAANPPSPAADAKVVRQGHRSGESPAGVETGRGPYGRIPAAPAVRRLLREHELTLDEVPGTGKQGRVLKDDVQRYLDAGGKATRVQQPDTTAPGADNAAAAEPITQGGKVEPLRGVRAVMARRMVEAATTIPHFQYGEEIDVTALLALRERLKPLAEAENTRLTLMPLFMKAMALAVKAHPILNARLNDEATEIHYQDSVNIGMAVDSRAGLMVPNVKGVERRTLLEVAAEIQRLTEDARAGRVAQQDLKGGTISISNIGALGGTYAAPIINAPEVAIVAIGKTQWLPRFDEHGEVTRRAIMTITWSGDHRIIDGGTIARFCNAWKGYLEAPETMLLHLG
ncbi:dihydrolipoyllysine-residue acetyltransferase [Halomonas urumqiensis]|uniref:Dihydrolipoamide acetyltransferase component of pyruvate dehydrogenase complex n=1 Tax=Halomonas urumqiensis TaxID=1684789 RepID=A0A2N7ULT7_9GAMM|nr:dihydrolipoyllysine-residue acetyltransferase [Halomonas urumqiensis]PMR81396.1 dihydrolipoamide acetyltransferase [Halomonas urumqiensis]PTB01196.1 dihydrolipoyllysine-residue acetyltransferase [Halomonas urumqiensis]GHE22771.1 dihydrolipoamide acetyltransferase component of pyruvate dehydrogenase complex [Halomonas urumqiensis]